VGVRKTPRLPRAAFLILCLVLVGALAGPAAARTAGKAHHNGKGNGRHALRSRAKHAKTPGTHTRSRVRAPSTPKPTVVKTHEKPAETRASKKADAAAQAAATIATVLATPCQSTEIAPEPSNVAAAREAILCLINRTRAEHSLEPLKPNGQLEAAAEDHNAEMLQVDYFAHVAPDGETPVDRIKKTGYIASESAGYVIGENLAWGTYSLSTPKAIVEAWIASPGHLANILESRYTETGIGVTPAVPQSLGEGNPGATYAQEFGVIVH
jgi:uncharacterized protein YkwD